MAVNDSGGVGKYVRGRPGRRQTNDYGGAVEELKKRYPDGAQVRSIAQLRQENPDMDAVLKTMQNNADKLFGMSLNDYFQQIGLLPAGKAEQLTQLLSQLKQRYPEGATLPKSIAQLKADNQDLPMNRLIYIKEVHGTDPLAYLKKEGLVRDAQKDPIPSGQTEEERSEAYLQLLARLYADKKKLPLNVKELGDENPDVPIRKLNRYLRDKGFKKVEYYYIKNHILQGKPTDLNTYTFYNLCFLEDRSHYWAFSDLDDLHTGDIVLVSRWDGPQDALVTEICTCMGIDAPCRPDGVTIRITGHTDTHRELLRVGKTTIASALERMEKSPDYPPLDPVPQKKRMALDLCKKDPWNQERYSISQLYFRGVTEEIRKLWEYLDQNEYMEYTCTAVNSRIAQLVIGPEGYPSFSVENEFIVQALRQFPALKVAGIVEDFNTQNVVEFYSESGADCITKAVCCGLFDPKADGLEGRWSCDLTDMMKPYHCTFYMLATSRRVIVDYEFRWVKEWEDDNYYVG